MLQPDESDPLPAATKPRDLQPMSIHELRDYIAALKTEIARAESAIAQKEAHKSGIEGLFRVS